MLAICSPIPACNRGEQVQRRSEYWRSERAWPFNGGGKAKKKEEEDTKFTNSKTPVLYLDFPQVDFGILNTSVRK